MYRKDLILITTFIVFLWATLLYVLMGINSLALHYSIRIIVFISGGLAGVFSTISLVAVIRHLSMNRISLYTEDIYYHQKQVEES